MTQIDQLNKNVRYYNATLEQQEAQFSAWKPAD